MFNLLTKVNIHKIPTAVGRKPLINYARKFFGGIGGQKRTKREQSYFIYCFPSTTTTFILQVLHIYNNRAVLYELP